ncbi:hypothetical protein LP090_12275 [Moraxella bovis]|uniref:hypothetical protein n=1 Tax=Moraxella bovis TaxID=476 RepID=UPI002225FCB9|nr:hypothetical protein [Moraxella bovis]UYZ71052.1 hypothetical protein LP089_00745 [Moraxella bovis]UYZ73030.1 hypothetical protein LP105_11880 [Moraxella bovis]UYZ95220.1 hypothetical protein LP121_01230 [Moraxella bovis]UZA14347.1 hypothetical protein LP102_00700 [Moraxella bovis]UZA42912.1 hypothetical protein LP090_12275 [Moraxella bovis]
MTDQLPKNALIKALPPAVRRFIARFFVTRAFVWLISIAFTLFVGASSFWLLMALWVHKPFGDVGTQIFMVFLACLAMSLTGFLSLGRFLDGGRIWRCILSALAWGLGGILAWTQKTTAFGMMKSPESFNTKNKAIWLPCTMCVIFVGMIKTNMM